MLAGHLGGIRHYKDNESLNSKHYDNVVAGLVIFQDDPLVSSPGTKFNYSSYGFNLLSAAIEKACAEDFLSCMRDLVFSPLGLRSTVADQPSELIEQRAGFYTHWKDKSLENSPYTENSYKWAGGGFPQPLRRSGLTGFPQNVIKLRFELALAPVLQAPRRRF